VAEQLRAVFLVYLQPGRAIDAILDSGGVLRSMVIAFAVGALLWMTSGGQVVRSASPRAVQQEEVSMVLPAILQAVRFVSPSGPGPAAMLGVVLLPVAILVLARWNRLGSPGVVLGRDYTPMLTVGLTLWSAAYLPIALMRFVLPPLPSLAAACLAHAFLLAVLCLSFRTVMSAPPGQAAIAVAIGWIASVLASAASGIWGPLLFWIASPWVLYMLWGPIQSEGRSLARGLSDRQALKRNLEAAAVNPHDADAQYQLGLVYRQRRNLEEARRRFEAAIAIDPHAADAHHELGRIALEQERFGDAVAHLRTAAGIDDKLSLSEVWRDFGIASLKAGDTEQALQALRKYTERRAYDPEGLVYYGHALRQAGRAAESRGVYESAIEAAETLPDHRRGVGKQWAREARQALKTISSL
jgi:tetratricopeptide (TPR) repeat protein